MCNCGYKIFRDTPPFNKQETRSLYGEKKHKFNQTDGLCGDIFAVIHVEAFVSGCIIANEERNIASVGGKC